MLIEMYASYGILSHEKRPVYTVGTPGSDIYDKIVADLPEDGFEYFYSASGELLVKVPGMPYTYGINDVLTNHGDDPVISWFGGGSYHRETVRIINTEGLSLFAVKLRYARRRANLSQVELAKKLGLNQNYISKWETGDVVPTIDSIYRLADALGCDPRSLI